MVGWVGGGFTGVVGEQVGKDSGRGTGLRAYGHDTEGGEVGKPHREGFGGGNPRRLHVRRSVALWSRA